jgi:membrane fusion protein (multidrug efflux system)
MRDDAPTMKVTKLQPVDMEAEPIELEATPEKPRGRRRRLVLLIGALAATVIFPLLLAARRTHGVQADNAFVAGHVTRIVSPLAGTVDVVGIRARRRADAGETAFVVNRSEHELAVAEAQVRVRAAVREELEQCVVKKSWDYKQRLARSARARSSHKLDQTARLAQHALVADEELRDMQFDDQQASINQELAGLESRRMGYDLALPPGTRKSVASAFNALHSALIELDRATLRVATDSYVYDVLVQPGQRVEQGALLAVVLPHEQLMIQANLLESQLAQVQVGQPAEVKLDSSPGLGLLRGHVTSIVPAAAAVFSPIPRGNVDSTWVKVSQRVPVFVAADDDVPLEQRPPVGSSAEVVLLTEEAAEKPRSIDTHPLAQEDRTAADFRARVDRIVAEELSQGSSLLRTDSQCARQLRVIANWRVPNER